MGQGEPGPRFERLIRDYGERAFQFAYRLSGNAEEAKDCVQEAFFRVLRSWEKYDETRSLDAWFFTILRHVFLDGRRRYERRMGVSLDASIVSEDGEAGTFVDLFPVEEESMLRRLERKEAGEAVRRTLDSLSYEHRVELTLCDMEAMNYEEIARVLEVPAGTVRSRISRARRAFRRKMARDPRAVG